MIGPRRRERLILGFGLLVSLTILGGLKYRRVHATSRPRYVFINETNNHAHDLAFKMSLKLAETRSGIENSLILLDHLPQGSTVSETAAELFQKWRIGENRAGRGLLFLHAKRENLFRIEVSYALEGIFPDALCRQLEEAAKTYLLSDIPQDFISELLITMNLRGQESFREVASEFRSPAWLTAPFLSGGAGVQTNTLQNYLEAIERLPRHEFQNFGPSPEPREVLERYLKSLQLGLGEPQLPLLTEGSQLFRAIVPRNGAQQLRQFSYFSKAMPYQFFRRGDLALALFRPGVATLPIVLRLSRDGQWYVDEPKSWTYFHRFESEDDFYPLFSDLVFLPDLKSANHPHALKPVHRNRVATPPVEPYPYSLQSRVRELEQAMAREPKNPVWPARLGELYLFEVNWVTRALTYFEKAAALDPERIEYRWRLWDLYVNHSEMEKALAQLQFLAEKLPADAETQGWLKHYQSSYQFQASDFP